MEPTTSSNKVTLAKRTPPVAEMGPTIARKMKIAASITPRKQRKLTLATLFDSDSETDNKSTPSSSKTTPIKRSAPVAELEPTTPPRKLTSSKYSAPVAEMGHFISPRRRKMATPTKPNMQRKRSHATIFVSSDSESDNDNSSPSDTVSMPPTPVSPARPAFSYVKKRKTATSSAPLVSLKDFGDNF